MEIANDAALVGQSISMHLFEINAENSINQSLPNQDSMKLNSQNKKLSSSLIEFQFADVKEEMCPSATELPATKVLYGTCKIFNHVLLSGELNKHRGIRLLELV